MAIKIVTYGTLYTIIKDHLSFIILIGITYKCVMFYWIYWSDETQIANSFVIGRVCSRKKLYVFQILYRPMGHGAGLVPVSEYVTRLTDIFEFRSMGQTNKNIT